MKNAKEKENGLYLDYVWVWNGKIQKERIKHSRQEKEDRRT